MLDNFVDDCPVCDSPCRFPAFDLDILGNEFICGKCDSVCAWFWETETDIDGENSYSYLDVVRPHESPANA